MSNYTIFIVEGLTCFICGGLLGVLAMALMVAAGRTDRELDEAERKAHAKWVADRVSD